MDDFETRLRIQLAEAGEAAPVFPGLESRRARSRGPGPWIGVAAAAVALAIGGGTWIASRDGTPPQTSCPAVMEIQGRTYEGHGEMLRKPRPGKPLGTGVIPGCDDEDRSVNVVELPGVDPRVAVLTNGGVWLAESVASVPPEVAELDELVACAGEGTGYVAGDWVAVEGPMPTRDDGLTPPYVAVIQADEGNRVPLTRWSTVTIKVRVSTDTVGADDSRLADRALRGPERVSVVVHCDGGSFVAESLAADR